MAKLTWDGTGERIYETGVKNGVLWVADGNAVAWNGLTAVNESPEGAEATALYADNIKYLNLISAEDFGFTIEAYTYPEEYEACDGYFNPVKAAGSTAVTVGQQARKNFGFCYRTEVGNDTDGNTHGYKVHFAYGCTASPSSKDYGTINDSPEAITFSWEVKTTPVTFQDAEGTERSAATLTIDTAKMDATEKAAFEAWLTAKVYDNAQKMPTIQEIITAAETKAWPAA